MGIRKWHANHIEDPLKSEPKNQISKPVAYPVIPRQLRFVSIMLEGAAMVLARFFTHTTIMRQYMTFLFLPASLVNNFRCSPYH